MKALSLFVGTDITQQEEGSFGLDGFSSASEAIIEICHRHPTWHISHETIYKYIYEQAKVGNDLRSYLRQGHRTRRKRKLVKDRRGVIADRVFINKRPTIVDQRMRIGDWEGDTVEGAVKKGYVATWTERRCKYLVAYTLDRKASDKLFKGAKRAFRSIPVFPYGKFFHRTMVPVCFTKTLP